MIDRKKLVQRLNRGSRLKELPLLHFAIILVTVVEVIGEGFRIFPLQMLKPVPIILMIVYIHDKNRARQHLVPRVIQAGIALSLVGDVCLMSNEMSSFMVGTCFFMVAHVLYLVGFQMGEKVKLMKQSYRRARWAAYVVVGIALLGNYQTLWDKLPSKVIFVPYMAILAVETMNCLARYERTVNSSFYFVVLGIVLFTVSDNLLGFLKFNQIKTDLGRAVVMLTYYSAQYFLMHGALHQSNLIFEINKFQEGRTKVY